MRSVGLLTSILMIIPMLVVPLLAILGIPQFFPVVASPTFHSERELTGRFIERRVGQAEMPADRTLSIPSLNDVDLFEPAITARQRADDNRLRLLARSWTDPLAVRLKSPSTHRKFAVELPQPAWESNALSAATPARQPLSVQLLQATNSESNRTGSQDAQFSAVRYKRKANPSTESVPATNRQRLTWRQAAQLLGRMGIRKYELKGGEAVGEFAFSCSVTSIDDRRISRQFQAASTEPLVAVEKVLVQVDNWMQGR